MLVFACVWLLAVPDWNEHNEIHAICLMIHIGEEIKKELERQERSQAWLARKLQMSRTTIRDTLKKNSIDTALLQRISTILGRNFFLLYTQNSTE
jgi:transcriptional regulator with XRE-family HTH domain